jgi:drug/metabolite transporter (DMT)-like permease
MLACCEDLLVEKERLLHLSAFLTICIVWALSLVIAYDLLDTGIPPFFLVMVTYGIGALTLLSAKVLFRSTPRIGRNELRCGIVAGMLIFGAFGLQTLGLAYTTPAKSGLLTVLYVLFVPVIISIIRSKLSSRSVLFALIGFAGVVVMSGVVGGDASMNFGDILTIFCAVMFAMHFVTLEKYSPSLNTVNFTLVQMITAATAAAAVSLLAENGQYSGMDLVGSWAGLAFMGLIVTGLGFFIQTAVQKKISATTVSVMCCSESVFAMMFSWALGFDAITFPLLAGAAMIVTSTVLSSIYEKRELIG